MAPAAISTLPSSARCPTLSRDIIICCSSAISAETARSGISSLLLRHRATQRHTVLSMRFLCAARQLTPFDSLTPPACAPAFLQLVFKKNILCGSIAADGSDFRVTGPSTVVVTGAAGQCDANGE